MLGIEELQRIVGGELPEKPRTGGCGSGTGNPTASAAIWRMGAMAAAGDELEDVARDIAEADALLMDFARCDVADAERKSDVMERFYIDREMWSDVAMDTSQSVRTCLRLRDRAVADMQAMGARRTREHGQNPQKAV